MYYIDLYDKNGKFCCSSDELTYKTLKHKYYHVRYYLIIVNNKNQILMQNYSKTAQTTDCSDFAITFHKNKYETIRDILISETFDVLGKIFKLSQFYYIDDCIDLDENEICPIIIIYDNSDINDFFIDEEIIVNLDWINYLDLKNIIYKKEYFERRKQFLNQVIKCLDKNLLK